MKKFLQFGFMTVGRLPGAIFLLLLAAASAALSFERLHWVLKRPETTFVLWVLLITSLLLTLRALVTRRWISFIFHAGATAVIIGGALTAGRARQWEVSLTDSAFAPPEVRQRVIAGDLMSLESFCIDRYPNGMPRQYYAVLRFPEGCHEISVNHPLRRKGFTYYQMSYGESTDVYGNPFFVTCLRIRRDPGAPIVFAGYGLLAAAALLMALREVRK